jgi:hypothetical protein
VQCDSTCVSGACDLKAPSCNTATGVCTHEFAANGASCNVNGGLGACKAGVCRGELRRGSLRFLAARGSCAPTSCFPGCETRRRQAIALNHVMPFALSLAPAALTAPGISPVPSPSPSPPVITASSPAPSPSPPPSSPSPPPQGTGWVKQTNSNNWFGTPLKGKAGKVALKKVAAADAPARCQAAAERASAAAFSIAATKGVPKFCFLFASTPTKQCGPGDKKFACKFMGLGAYARQP